MAVFVQLYILNAPLIVIGFAAKLQLARDDAYDRLIREWRLYSVGSS